MRFVLMIVGLAFAVLVGLYIYGQILTPETRIIEQEATGVRDV